MVSLPGVECIQRQQRHLSQLSVDTSPPPTAIPSLHCYLDHRASPERTAEYSGHEQPGDARDLSHGVHDEQREQLVGLGDGAGGERVTEPVLGVDHQAGVAAHRQQEQQAEQVDPDGAAGHMMWWCQVG